MIDYPHHQLLRLKNRMIVKGKYFCGFDRTTEFLRSLSGLLGSGWIVSAGVFWNGGSQSCCASITKMAIRLKRYCHLWIYFDFWCYYRKGLFLLLRLPVLTFSYFFQLVGAGFEVRRSIQLSYGRTGRIISCCITQCGVFGKIIGRENRGWFSFSGTIPVLVILLLIVIGISWIM